MCRLEAIDGNSVVAAIDEDSVIFGCPFNDWVRSIIRWL